MNITQTELKNILLNVRGATPVTIVTCTVPKVKKSCPIRDVRKVATINGFINFNYEKSVNRTLEKSGEEANFVASERAWGEHESLSVISNNGKSYLQMKVEKTLESDMFSGSNRLTDEEKQLVKQHMASYKESPVVVRTFSLENIRRITIKGTTYEVI